ncbi:hypothetical protein N7452_004188 [Penicillium brevicompactum]|uniref:Tc1-like transposase DDE domain-containing protein n=1 Tax=Penicillium brevicompactum TaxID=5074 RepID=A0A9W9QWI9_PENBR|nr:hypothetical protein N7452_004188 [Penicillium brevicompactum]
MADAAECSEKTIKNTRRNLRLCGQVHAPSTRIGRRRRITPPMLEALCDHLLEKPGFYLDEMAIFLWDDIRMPASTSSIRRALVSRGWSKKTARQTAREQNDGLREIYLHNLSDFESYQLVYVDEFRYDKRIGFRRTGWSPLGVAPRQVSQFHRDERYQILPAYTQDGILVTRVFRGSTDATVFEDFIDELLRHVGDGRSRTRFWSWIMHLFTALSGFYRCVLMRDSNEELIYHHGGLFHGNKHLY